MSDVAVARSHAPFKRLTGPDKVAALLLAMGKPLADRILRHFDEAEIKVIARSASVLGTIPKPVLDKLIEEFAEGLATGTDLQGTLGDAEQLLAGIIPPERVAEIMSDVKGQPAQSIWSRLNEIPHQAISQFIAKEHPQVGAFILSKAPPACAAGVLSYLTSDQRNELMRRMLSIKPITDQPQKTLEIVMHEDLMMKVTRNTGPDIHAKLADIINKMERQHMDEVLNSLEEHRPKEAKRVKGLLFTFDDIAKLSNEARSKLIDQVPPERVILALKGAEPHLRDLILASVGARARRMIEQEVASGASAPQKEIAKARRAIADLALEMIERGLIEMSNEAEAEE
ncbi:MAG: flagellar motor switch protein FliG [Hyphomicrobiaceae bacterium]